MRMQAIWVMEMQMKHSNIETNSMKETESPDASFVLNMS